MLFRPTTGLLLLAPRVSLLELPLSLLLVIIDEIFSGGVPPSAAERPQAVQQEHLLYNLSIEQMCLECSFLTSQIEPSVYCEDRTFVWIQGSASSWRNAVSLSSREHIPRLGWPPSHAWLEIQVN